MSELTTGTDLLASARMDKARLVVAVRGDIDMNNSPELRRAALDLIDVQKPSKLVMNLSDVSYMDSSAIAVLVELLRRMGRAKERMALTNLQPRVKGLLEIARLNTIFEVAADEADALK